MDLSLTPDEQAFRDEFRAWLEANHPGPAPHGGDQVQYEFEREWQRKLHAGGWAGVSWPKEYGGRGATLIEQSIFGEELARAKAPRPANVLGLVMGGPVVIAHGTEEQKERFLEPILSAEEIWCQGFSEPESGSDLASLKTKAVKENGGWRITGQKVWTTFAHEAKWCMLVARTDDDVPKHKGLTYFLMDMEQDEVEVRPLRQITGEAEFNELFIENAYVPDENVVGGVGNGWMVAITTLMNERAGLGASAALGLSNALEELIELGDRARRCRRPARPRQDRAPEDRDRGPAPRRDASPDRDDEGRHPGPRGLDREAAVVVHQPGADRARARGRRDRHAHPRRPLGLPVPALARELDRGRDHGRAQEHRRRASPRAAEAPLTHHEQTNNEQRIMDFAFNDEQREIKSTAHEFIASRFKPEKVRELAESESPYDDALWKEMCELGWPGIAIAEEHGGQGLGVVELVILQEELGYACAPSPMISNAFAGALIQEAGSDEQRAAWLPGIASGEHRAAAAFTPEEEPVVGAAAGAEIFVLNEGMDGARLVEPGDVRLERLDLIDTTRAYFRASADGRRPASRRRHEPRSTSAPSRSPPSWSGSRSARSTWRSSTRRSASSSGARSAPIRRSRTGSRRCSGKSRRHAR